MRRQWTLKDAGLCLLCFLPWKCLDGHFFRHWRKRHGKGARNG